MPNFEITEESDVTKLSAVVVKGGKFQASKQTLDRWEKAKFDYDCAQKEMSEYLSNAEEAEREANSKAEAKRRAKYEEDQFEFLSKENIEMSE